MEFGKINKGAFLLLNAANVHERLSEAENICL